jgi:hypothetical protein
VFGIKRKELACASSFLLLHLRSQHRQIYFEGGPFAQLTAILQKKQGWTFLVSFRAARKMIKDTQIIKKRLTGLQDPRLYSYRRRICRQFPQETGLAAQP